MSDSGKSPTIDELQGRIIVLEAMVMAALGLASKRPARFSSDLIYEMLNGVKSGIGGRLIREGCQRKVLPKRSVLSIGAFPVFQKLVLAAVRRSLAQI